MLVDLLDIGSVTVVIPGGAPNTLPVNFGGNWGALVRLRFNLPTSQLIQTLSFRFEAASGTPLTGYFAPTLIGFDDGGGQDRNWGLGGNSNFVSATNPFIDSEHVAPEWWWGDDPTVTGDLALVAHISVADPYPAPGGTTFNIVSATAEVVAATFWQDFVGCKEIAQ